MVLSNTVEPETSLVEQAKKGDRNAFGELVRRHYQGVVRVVTRMCGDTRLAEDATQEAFIRAWVNLPTFHAQAPLQSWLYRIAINAALDSLRNCREEPLEDAEVQIASEPAEDPEAVLIEKEQAAVLQQAMKSLPEAARAVLVLREYGGLSYQEIAGVLDIPVGTVMSRLNYARSRLREKYASIMTRTESQYA